MGKFSHFLKAIFGASCLTPDGNDYRRNSDERQRRKGNRHFIAMYKFAGAVCEAVGSGADRLMLEIALEIIGESNNRSVALLGSFFQRFAENCVQVASELAADLFRSGSTFLSSDRAIRRSNRVRGSRRFGIHDRLNQ